MVAKPISDIFGLAATGYDAIRGDKDGDPTGFRNEIQRALTYEPRTNAGRLTAEYNPLALLGRGVNAVGSFVEGNIAPPDAGPFMQAVGAGVHEAINQAPQFMGAAAKPIVEGVGNALRGAARTTMQSALKPTIAALRTGKADRAITTMLDEGINVSRSGVDKMQGRIDQLNTDIRSQIANSPAIVDKYAVASRLNTVMNDFVRQVAPRTDLAAVQRVFDDFTNHPLLQNTRDIPVALAQEMKQGTYRSLGDKAYGELKGADITAQKALARGLKEEIVAAVPAVRQLNAAESQLLNALSVSERRVMMEANKNPLGLGWLTTDPVKFSGWMADRSGAFKSLIARMLNTTGEATVSSAAAAPMIGVAATAEANERKNKLAMNE
jgi:hypothetical protein